MRLATTCVFLAALLATALFGCDSQHRSTTASGDFDTPITSPVFEPGYIVENSHICMNAADQSTFSDSHNFELPLPTSWIGPNMSWKGQTAGFALTKGSLTPVVPPTPSQYHGKLIIENVVGGKCGPNGTNTGGYGTVGVHYRTTFNVPAIPPGVRWAVRLSTDCTYSGVAGSIGSVPCQPVTAGPVENCQLEVTPFSGPGTTYTFTRAGKDQFLINDLRPGQYTLKIRGSHVTRGCYGAAENTDSRGNAKIELDVEIFAYN